MREKIVNMKKHIALCGLDCSSCHAYIATKNNDNSLRKKTAKEWNDRYRKSNPERPPIKAEDINCNGCLSTGPVYLYCRRCKIRLCGLGKKVRNCKECKEYRCKDLIELQRHFFKPEKVKIHNLL